MIRTHLGIVGVVLLSITAGCLGAAPAATGGTDLDGGEASPTIGVSASGSVSVEPDLAVVTVAAEARADSADAARERVAADVAAVREALAELGLAGDAVTTAYFAIQPAYDYTGETRELVGYQATHALAVEAGPDRAGAVIDAAVGAGAARVDGVRFTLADETQQSAREQALDAAMANAAADAGAIARAADLTLDGVRSASTGGPTVVPFEGRTVAADAAGSTTIDPGPLSVTATVQVVYAVA